MPTVEFSLKDLNKLSGENLTEKDLEPLLEYAKAELEGYDKDTDTLTINFGDTNLPYLWSVEGLVRLLKGILGKEKGVPEIKVHKSENKIIVDKNLANIRPYIAAFTAKGKNVNEFFLKQLIQFQEKLCDSFGRKRRKIAIGIYPYKEIVFPVHYKAIDPKEAKFIPLEFRTELNLAEILEVHPSGKKFAFTLEDKKKYPILMDDENNVLSFPPIINSQKFGKVDLNTKELFIEITGTDFEAVNLVCNILAYVFDDRGFDIESVEINYHNNKLTTPTLKKETIKIKEQDIISLLGINLKKVDVKKLLEKSRYDFDDYTVTIPPYRADILHSVDVIEDIAIVYGYDNFPTTPLTSHTMGYFSPIVHLINK